MRKILSLLAIVALALQLSAAPVDPSTAKTKAEQYLAQKVYVGKAMAPGATEATLIKTEMGEKASTPVYYIFNTATTFVIVSGDDRAEEILAYGDKPLNLNRSIPKNVQVWLDNYKEQLDWLLTHPEVKVEKPTTFKSPKLRATTIGPLMTALWDQEAPYNNLCKFTYSGTTYTCLTGCPATSASMVLYYWKYPTETVGPLPAYSSTLDIGGGYWGNQVSFTYPALAATTFDWDNMIDDYTSSAASGYNTTQGNAVATLMRYVGQAEHMMYGVDGSGIYTTEAQVVADMFIGFGYDEVTTRLVHKSEYTETTWAQLLQEEMAESRPVVFMAVDSYAGGHAFNVDGYNSSTNKYHINFGWSGDANNWCSMNAFSGGGYTFNSDQQMVIGIQPPMGVIKTNPSEVNFNGFAGETYTQIVKVQARNIENNVNIALTGDNVYSVSHTTITPAEAANGVDVTVTYAPTQAGNTSATMTLTCADEDVETVTVPITGAALPRVPTLLVEPESLSFAATLSMPMNKTITLTGAFLTHDVTVTLSDNNGVFTVSPTTISMNSTNVDTPVPVTVTFNSPFEGNFNGTITFTSEGAETKTVTLDGKARDGGTASDPFLDLSQYETITEAGAAVTGMSAIYKYTEYEDQECAWLTMSNYGAYKADTQQKWLETSSLSQYNNSWDATDIFLGDAAYFGSNQAYSIYGSGNQAFFVTNCIQAKALVKGGSYSTSNASLAIYECTLNADGSVTASNNAIDIQQGSNGVITSTTLDASKIYKVQLNGGGSYPDLLEIGFKTELNGVEVPVATAATEVKADGFTANWTLCPSATSYTLRVMPKPAATLLMTETFAKCTSAGAQDVSSTLDNYLDNPGWSGSKLYTAVGGIRLGTGSSTGALTSPVLNLSADNKVSVRLKANAYNNDTDCNLKISCGSASETITLPNNSVEEYTVVLDCTAADQKVTIETTAKSKRVVITEIELYSGDITKPVKGFGESIFTGITDINYVVTGLLPGTTYLYDVKAVAGGKEGRWSNKIEVVTLNGVTGDVNGDGEITSADITALFNFILLGDDSDIVNGDVNGDGEITSADITAIYDIILTSK